MAYKRFLTSLIRHRSSSIFNLSNPQSLHSLKTLASSSHLPSLQLIPHILNLPDFNPQFLPNRSFSSSPPKNPKTPKVIEDEDEEDDESDEEWDEDDDEDEDEYEDEDSDGNEATGRVGERRVYSAERKIAEAEDIGYKVIGPLQPSDRVFKPYVPVFAVVQIGSHQFKVSNGDSIYVEKLKFCDVNDKLVLNKVLMLGSPTQTIIGRPIVPDSAVHAVVEEHALDAKVIIFKKKRRKNYRRTKGHRQELTRLRITDIQGIEKPKTISRKVNETSTSKKVEEVAVPA